MGTSFVSELFYEKSTLLKIHVEHASLKHPLTAGVVERSPSALQPF